MTGDAEIFRVLQEHRVPFVVIGGYAVNFHGYIRATEDLDLFWLRTPDTESSLHIVLNELEARYIGSDIDPATGIERTYPVSLSYVRGNHLMMLNTKFGFLDLFDYIPGLPSEIPSALCDASVESDGVRYVSLDWLRRMKRASGRDKDLLDLKNLPE